MNSGGRQHSRDDIDKMRQEQERKQQMEARFEKVRQRVSASIFYILLYVLKVSVCVQEKRAEYHRQQREKEEEQLHKMKQTQREKVADLLTQSALHNCALYYYSRLRGRKLEMKNCVFLSRKR